MPISPFLTGLEEDLLIDGTELIEVRGADGMRRAVPASRLLAAAAGGGGTIMGRMPSILIAASNSPAYVKDKADYVCTGVDDNLLIQSVIDGFPVMPNFERSKVLVSGGKYGFITLAPGKFVFSSALVIPAGSVIRIDGAGVSSWRPIDNKGSQYEGGTLIYSTNADGRAIFVPQYTGNRTDDGMSNTIPTSGVMLQDFEVVAANPVASTPSTNYVINLTGMTTGIIRNINVFADLTVNAEPRINGGIALGSGARTDRKTMAGIHSFFFRNVGILLNTTHLDASQLVAGNITGGTSPAAFQITPNQNMRLSNLHAFSANIGMKFSSGGEVMNIDSVMMESITNCVSLTRANTAGTIKIDKLYLNADTTFTGDVATGVQIGWLGGTLTGQDASAKRIRNGGTVTIPAGSTSAVIPHLLIASPLSWRASVRGGGTINTTSQADATNLTVTIPSQGSDTVIQWAATATIGEIA
jgi:hypothetical protein